MEQTAYGNDVAAACVAKCNTGLINAVYIISNPKKASSLLMLQRHISQSVIPA